MNQTIYKGKIPFYNGNHATYMGGKPNYEDGSDWRENIPFRAILTITDYYRGRSSVTISLEDDAGHKYEMFLSEFMGLVLHDWKPCIWHEGARIEGLFAFVKRGANYGIVALEDE